MSEVIALALAASAFSLAAMLWAAQARCKALDERRTALEAELDKTRSELTRCTQILARRLDELRAAEAREAETAARVAQVMHSADTELGFYAVKVGYCAAFFDDWPALFHHMLELAEAEIVKKWREDRAKHT